MDKFVKKKQKKKEFSSEFCNLAAIILFEIRPEGATILAVKPTKRPANTRYEPKFNRKQSPKCWCLSLLVANESKFHEGYDSDVQMGPFFGAVYAEGDQLFKGSH